MLSIYQEAVGYDSLDDMVEKNGLTYDHSSYYYPRTHHLIINPMEFKEDDEYQLFLINIKMGGAIPAQHFVVVIKRNDNYYSMGFGSGPNGHYVLKSPDPYMKKISDMEEYKDFAFDAFKTLSAYTPMLNKLISTYTSGGYIRFKNGKTGFYANHNTVTKHYNVFTNMCLSGFESVFPIPTNKLHSLERLCFYSAVGRGKSKGRRRRNRKTKKHIIY